MSRVKPQNHGPGQMIRCQSVRGVHSLVAMSHTPDAVARSRTAKESASMRSAGATASLPRKPRNLTGFSKRVMTAPPEGGQRRLRGGVPRDGIGIEVLARGRLRQLLDDAGAYLPTPALDRGLLPALADLSIELGAAQLAFDLHVVALFEALREVGGRAEGDDAVPLGVVHPLLRLLVLVAGLGGERQYRE